jgi:hypothetical protein
MSVVLVTWEVEIRKMMVRDQPRLMVHEIPHLQNNQSKINWTCDSSSRAPVLPSRSPEFKLQFPTPKRPIQWNKIFTYCISEKGFEYRKKFYILIVKTKCVKDLNRHFSKEVI